MESDEVSSVHAAYNFHCNGTKIHSGTNVLTLVSIDKEWKISHITDTRFY
jgi:hypothetical protein